MTTKNLKLHLAEKLTDVTNDWRTILVEAFTNMDATYLTFLIENNHFIPDKNNFLNAFKNINLKQTRYILFGQDPYPRKESAIGEAFIDGAVKTIWSENGLSKEVNKATSLRNFIKMLILSHNLLGKESLSQKNIAKINKQNLIQTIFDLRDNFVSNGVLLINTSLIFTDKKDTSYHIKNWKPFFEKILSFLPNEIYLILLGNFAKKYVSSLKQAQKMKKIEFEHPYNVSFVYSKQVQCFFRSMQLIFKKS